MKKLGILLSIIAVLCILPMAISAQEKDAEMEIEITGEAVDISCYLGGKSGEGHASCAATCVKGGKPIGFVIDKEGEMMMMLIMDGGSGAAKDILGDHMGKQITIKGKYSEKDGLKIFKVDEVTG